MAKKLILIGLALIILFYLPTLFLPEGSLLALVQEDGFYESVGALLFFFASIAFFFTFFKVKRRNLFWIIFALAFFFAAGEEIAWGQRIFGFETPPGLSTINAQGELTIHNLNFIQHKSMDGGIVSFIKSMMNFNRLFIAFWIVYCILIPLVYQRSTKARNLLSKIRLPVISIWFGFLFALNEILCRMLEFYGTRRFSVVPPIYEIKESLWALLVFLMGLYFLLLLYQPSPGIEVNQKATAF